MSPWLNANRLQATLAATAMVVIDAAQSAFGYLDFAPPPGGAMLSCPRKSTKLTDGAVLALARGVDTDIAHLATAKFLTAMKAAARAIWTTGDLKLEPSALKYNRRSEENWPDTPHRMSDVSRALLASLDRAWHTEKCRCNRRVLATALSGKIAIWKSRNGVPFSLPVFVRDQDATLASLRSNRIFASALWPDAQLDPKQHVVADWLARHLVSLPVDQRHDEVDMLHIAKAVLRSADPPASPPPLGRWIG